MQRDSRIMTARLDSVRREDDMNEAGCSLESDKELQNKELLQQSVVVLTRSPIQANSPRNGREEGGSLRIAPACRNSQNDLVVPFL